MSRTFVVAFDLPTVDVLNANQRLHRMKQANTAAGIRQTASLWAKQFQFEPMTRAHCLVNVGWPDRKRRDVHNWYPTIKPAIDGIVSDAGLLPDDSDAYLIGPDLRAYHAGKRGFVCLEFIFTEIDEEVAA